MGNRSTGRDTRGVRRTLVRLPGFLVQATICVPKAHAHALWLLPWVERMLESETPRLAFDQPPWPHPADPLVVRQLTRTLLDLRWAVPDWAGDGVVVDPELASVFQAEGRVGLARRLFDADVLPGEWWADGLSGTLLARQTATQFDWDLRREADVVLETDAEPQALLDAAEPDLADLITKLSGVDDAWSARNRAFLGTSLIADERKDILFPMFGDAQRLMPDELGELEPVLLNAAPDLFGERRVTRSRVVRLPRSPVEQVAAEIERLPADPSTLGPPAVVYARSRRLVELCDTLANELADWLNTSTRAWPVCGPTQRQFDALAEIAGGLSAAPDPVLLMTTAFLSPGNASEPDGLCDALQAAPPNARFLVVYGHASDDTPERQLQDIDRWRDALATVDPDLAKRTEVVASRRRSHEKVVVSSAGGWMLGSWNPGSSRPGALVFECSVAGEDPAFAGRLLDAVKSNVEGSRALELVARLEGQLRGTEAPKGRGTAAVARLRRAAAVVQGVVPAAPRADDASWSTAIHALRVAFHPFATATHLELLDEQQTRDAFMTHARSAQRSVLLASDRLADSALDAATLRDLGGAGRARPLVRVVWGREWAGKRPADQHSRDQLRRARRTVQDARELLGDRLLVSDEPMENHAKALIVDGLRGLITSENLLSYGGEKGRYESRELGVAFWSPALAKELLGRFLLHWPNPLANGGQAADASLLWLAAGNDAWHALSSISNELNFDWESPAYVEAVVRDEAKEAAGDQHGPRLACLRELERRIGPAPFRWLRQEGERTGLLHAGSEGAWRPWNGLPLSDVDDALATAEALELRRTEDTEVAGPTIHPLVERVLGDMVRVEPGRFLMGDDRVRDDRPRHPVTISRGFLLGRTPVTQGLWHEVMGTLPHLRDVDRHPEYPIIHISREDIRRFLDRLNALPGSGAFDLPTEAEWEYACRAGSSALYCFGDEPGPGDRPGRLEDFAWTKRNSRRQMQRVGLLRPNAWGLHDMHGLVYETMRDGFRPYRRDAVVDPVGPLDGERIVARGGCWSRWPIDERRPWQEHFRCASRQVYEKGPRCSIRLAWYPVRSGNE